MPRLRVQLKSKSPGQTLKIARELGKSLKGGEVLALEGNLGSGKTLFVQGLARGLKVHHPEDVRSPSFSLIQEHGGPIPLCHADLYRLSPPEIKALGLEEYWSEALWVIAVEWAGKGKKIIPEGTALKIHFQVISEKERNLLFEGGAQWKKALVPWIKKYLP